jgi:hypothetical protein
MIAERGNDRVQVERETRLIIAAKARIWASEGWSVVVTDGDGKTYQTADFEKLLGVEPVALVPAAPLGLVHCNPAL